MKKIEGFQGEYRFLSNFYPCTFRYLDNVWPSAEHAYQAQKAKNPEDVLTILQTPLPGRVKRFSRKMEIRKDWNTIKFGAMRDVVFEKFNQNVVLKEKLLATGDSYIEETNNWGDTFWGVSDGTGENNLGHILMDLRDQFSVWGQ